MKVFISWSREPSRTIAEELKHLIEMSLPGVSAWMSDLDIGKGQRWSQAVAAELDETNVGIICCTPNNLSEPWLHFEAGALSKSVTEARVLPLCFNVPVEDLPGALGLFQCTKYSRNDVFKLISAINEMLTPPSRQGDFEARFQRAWKNFEEVANAELGKLNKSASDTVSASVNGDIVVAGNSFISVLTNGEESVLKLMAEMGDPGVEKGFISSSLNSKLVRVKHYLAELLEKDYIYAEYSVYDETKYHLTPRGSAYAVAKLWV